MYREHKFQKSIGQWTVATLGVGVSILVLTLLSQATSLSNVTTSSSKLIGFGPLHILEISKIPVDGGYSGSFAIQSGIVYYFVLLFAIAVVGSYISSKHLSSSNSPQ